MSPKESPNAPDPPARRPWLSYSVGELLLAITLAAVIAALYAYRPGLGIFAAVLAIPVCLRTFLVLRRRHQLGIATTRGQRIGLLLASAMVVIVMFASLAGVMTVALFAALLIACSGDEQTATRTLYVAGGIAVAFVLVLFPLWIRRRWIRDTRHPLQASQPPPIEPPEH